MRAQGAEVGLRSAIVPGLQSFLAIFLLDVDSELVFVGDAGATRSAAAPNQARARRTAYIASPALELAFEVFNLLDRAVKDIEYFYESRLAGEPAPVADVHLHPAEPRNVRGTLKLLF